ncbi:MAG: HNH endonuclease signature motif containing protein [Victivallales bacterium]
MKTNSRSEIFSKSEQERIKAKYNTISRKKAKYPKVKFKNKGDFLKWYIKQWKKQNGTCFYCKCKENDIRLLFDNKIIETKRKRGRAFEVERLSPNGNYEYDNCALACYFCNNDKSDIISSRDYSKFFSKSRQAYIKELLRRMKNGCRKKAK